jgi:hypothetical protein
MKVWHKILLQCLCIAMRLCSRQLSKESEENSFSWLDNAINELQNTIKEKQ